MIVRVTIANVDPRQLAARASEALPGGTVREAFGFSQGWEGGAIEPAAELEAAVVELEPVGRLVRGVLRDAGEDAAYVTLDGERAELWYADGRTDVLSTPAGQPA